jgi:hypothetical protein
MDLNDLLTTTRAEFLGAFLDATQKAIPRCIDDLFKKADISYSSSEQGRLLNARSVLQDQGASLIRQMSKNMEGLLTRSFQTTYNTFRPNAALSFSAESLTLVDATAFEDELRIDDITKRFRSEAEEQLRDLSIRIALIFEQDVTSERENPFRPYMFTRCIATSFENFGLSQETTFILVSQFSESFIGFVPKVYDTVNKHLASHGIAAQLQFKIKKSPTQLTLDSELGDEVETDSDQAEQFPAPNRAHGAGRSNKGMDPNYDDLNSRAMSTDKPRNQVEQLFDSVRGMASGLGARRSATAESEPELVDAAKPESGKQFAWLGGGQAVGGVLRKFFGGGSTSASNAEAEGFGHTIPGTQMSSTSGGIAQSRSTPSGSGHYSPEHQASAASNDDVVAHDNRGGASGNGGTSAAPGASGPASSGVPSEGGGHIASSVHGMQKSHTPATADMWDKHGAVRNLILEQRAALNEMTQNIDEQMTIDIVAMLFEFILRDGQVPAEVRAQLGRLQFMVLKVALRDTSLLTQKGHPARMLVNRIGSISLGLKQLDPSGNHITAEICRIVETLLQDDSENPQLFSRMLDEFDAFIARELRGGDKNVERAVEAVEQVQNRTLRFAHTAAQMGEALLGLTIDPYLQDFLKSTWVHVVEFADRHDAKRAQAYRLLVPDLLWSIVPKLREDDRAQLFALLPIILNSLREGLALIKWDAKLQQDLLNWLVDAHTSALRSSHSATLASVPSLSVIHQHFDNFVNNPEVNPKSAIEISKLPDSQKFLDQAIKELDFKVQMLDQVFDQELPVENLDLTAPVKPNVLSPEAIQERLRSGVALEINLGGKPSQGWLNWVDPALTNLVLSMNGQEAPSVVSVRMFRRMIAHGRVRFLESEPLFERAVQSLLKSADNLDNVSIV